MKKDILAEAATEARGLAIDAVHAAGIGHLGLPLGCAEIGAALFGDCLRYQPSDPRWLNRDRFVLSAGHGSMFLYAWLHLSGYDLPIEEVKNFRQLHSKTPGHPESFMTPGVEATTGPLGQGVGNAVGMALSLRMCAARYNTERHTLFDAHVICLAGDGCLQEGVAREAVAYAGHFKLDNLILIFDDNLATLDAQAEETQSEDVLGLYQALGWDVVNIDGHDMEAVAAAVWAAKHNDNGKPKLIAARTIIGKGIEQVEGSWKAHGEGGHKYADEARNALGLPEQKTFYVSDEVKTFFAEHRRKRLDADYENWQRLYTSWKQDQPELARELESASAGERLSAEELLDKVPVSDKDADATRNACGAALQPLAEALPLLVTGSADLFGSTKNYLKDCEDFTPENHSGRNFRFGIREHAMGAIVNGLGYEGIWIPSGATFLTFSDYMRASIRLAALSHLPVFHIFTHDSVGVGEDGPTHQPVETTSALRLIPQLTVYRPADAEETAAAVCSAIADTSGPTALILSRQKVPALNAIPVETRRKGVLKGGYVAREASGALQIILMATGSELQLALDAAEALGEGVRVVSMPSFERFNAQDSAYQESVLPAACRKRVAVEAGVSGLWHQYVGLDGTVVGVDRFGLSAPGDTVMRELGMTTEAVVEAARKLLG